MNKLCIDSKFFKSISAYFLIIILIFLNTYCTAEKSESLETNNVNEKLISQQWIRDSYLNKNSDSNFVNYTTKSEFQFLSNGNLIIKEPQTIYNTGGIIPPPYGYTDTLLINGTWNYYKNSNIITIQVDNTNSQNSTYNYNYWELTYLDNNQFEIENREKIDSLETIKVSFKSKI